MPFMRAVLRLLAVSTLFGLLSGAAALAFYFGVKASSFILLGVLAGYRAPEAPGEGGEVAWSLGRYWLIPVIAAAGGLAVGLIRRRMGLREYSTDEVLNAYHNARRLGLRETLAGLLASAITLGSGGSAGAEGPTGRLAAGLASAAARVLKLRREEARLGLIVSLGAGIGAIFKAPMGGAVLASEILYREGFERGVLYPALVASAVSYALFGSVVGFAPIFGGVSIAFDPLYLPLFAALGAIEGGAAVLYVLWLRRSAAIFRAVIKSEVLRPALGGLATGLVGLVAPEVVGPGYGWAYLALRGSIGGLPSPLMPIWLLLALLPLLKILATGLTLGSGEVGGVFIPGIIIGAFAGLDVGLIFHRILGVPTAPFVLVGMLSLLGAAAKAPLSVTLMVVELTGGYNALPYAMVAIAVAYLASGKTALFEGQLDEARQQHN